MESLAVAGRALRLRRNLSYALVALAASFGGAILTGCAGAEGEEETEVAEADIDVALFSSYKDYASPDDAGPVWFGNSMNAEGSKHTTHAVRGFGTISEPVISYPTGKVTSSNTGTVGLMPGRYGVLVQFLPKGGRRGALGTVKLLEYGTSNVQRPTRTEVLGTVGLGVGMSGDTSDAHARSDGFYRGYFRFELGKGKPKTYRIVVESNGSTGWETGLVSLHKEGRPFFAIAHNPDSIEGLEKALAEGANALGPDLMYSALTPDRIEVAHPNIFSNTDCSSERDGRSDFRAYLRKLNEKAPKIPVIWDVKPNYGAWVSGTCKNAPGNLAAFASLVRTIAHEEKYDLGFSTMSVPEMGMTPFFDGMTGAGTGRSVDGLTTFVNSNDVVSTWVLPAQTAQLTWSGLGISASELRVTQKWTLPVAGLVRARETRAFPKKVDYWTVADEWEIRRMLDLGVDGLIADSIPVLRRVLASEPYRTIYRYADTGDSSLEKFGGTWMCQRSCVVYVQP